MRLQQVFGDYSNQLRLGISGALLFFLAACSGAGGGPGLSSSDPNIDTCQQAKSSTFGIAKLEIKSPHLVGDGKIEFDLQAVFRNCTAQDLPTLQLDEINFSSLESLSASTVMIPSLAKGTSSASIKVGTFRKGIVMETAVFSAKTDVAGTRQDLFYEISVVDLVKPSLSLSQKEIQITTGSKVSNGDQSIDPGEVLSFKLESENPSKIRLDGLSMVLQSDNTSFSIQESTSIIFGGLEGAEKRSSSLGFNVQVSASAVRGSTANLKVILTDTFNNTWEKVFPASVSVSIPNIAGNKNLFQIISGAISANGNDVIDPGEKISFIPVVMNNSAFLAKNISVKITSSSPYFTVSNTSPIALGDIDAFSSIQGSSPFEISIAQNTPQATTSTISYEIKSEYGDIWNYSFTVQSNPYPPVPRKTQVLNLRANAQAIGFSSDSTKWYLLVKENYGGGVYYYNIYGKEPAGTQFSYICGLIEEDILNLHLAVDDYFFYLTEDYGFRRINKSNCSLSTKYSVSVLPNNSAKSFSATEKFSLNVNAGNLTYSNAAGSGGISVFDTFSLGDQSFSGTASLSGQVLNLEGKHLSSVNDKNWILDSSGKRLWRLNSNFEADSFGSGLTAFDSLFESVKVFVAETENLLLLLRQDVANVIRVSSVNVAEWKAGAEQKFSGNMAEESISLGVPPFSGCGNGRITTSAPGCSTVQSISSISLGTDTQFRGLAVDSTGTYLLAYENLGNQIAYYRVYRKLNSGVGFDVLCSYFDDSVQRTTIVVDSNYIYLGSSGNVDKYDKTSCAFVSQASFSYLNSRSISIDDGFIYFGSSGFPYDLSSRNLDGTGLQNFSTAQTFGARSLSPSSTFFAVSGGVRWAFDSNTRTLWKLNSVNKALGWLHLDPSIYTDLNNVKSIAVTESQKVIIAAEPVSGNLKLFEIDISDFQTTTGNLTSQSLASLTVNLNRVSTACPAGEFATSSGGCYKLIGTQSYSVPTDNFFSGFAADSGKIYFGYLNPFIGVYTISSFVDFSTSSVTECAINNSTFRANLAVDSNSFYVGKSLAFGVVDKSTCAIGSDIVPSGGIGSWSSSFSVNFPFSLVSSGGNLFYTRSGGTSDYGLYELSSGNVTNLNTNSQTLLGKTFYSLYNKIIVSGTTVWSIDRANKIIWKLNSSFQVVAWAALPVTQYPDLEHVKGVATKDGQTVYIATEKVNGTVQIFRLDLSSF
jgi:hypothetical protein